MGTTARSPGLRSITARQWMILLSVQLSSLLFGMTITLANVVLPQIRGALSATYDEIAWVVTLNLVATAIATPTTGWLASGVFHDRAAGPDRDGLHLVCPGWQHGAHPCPARLDRVSGALGRNGRLAADDRSWAASGLVRIAGNHG